MRKAVTLLAATLLPAFLSTAFAQAPDDFELRVLYTGRLLGYFHQELTPTQQECLKKAGNNGAATRCSTPQFRETGLRAGEVLGRVETFWSEEDAIDGNSLLLGMGDNLSPDLGARLRRFWWNGTDFLPTQFDRAKNLLPQKGFAFLQPEGKEFAVPYPGPHLIDEYRGHDRMGFAAEDNVVNFLLLSGYRAVVPGREDFLYGALWLQQLGAKLHELSDHTDGNLTRMLAANLRVSPVQAPLGSFDWIASAPEKPKPPCPLFFSPNLYSNLPAVNGCDKATTTSKGQKDVGYTELSLTDSKGAVHSVQVIAVVDGGTAGSGSGSNDLLREVASDRKRFYNVQAGHRAQYEVIVTKPDQELQKILAETADKKYDMRILLAQMPRASALQLASTFGRTHKACVVSNPKKVSEDVFPFDAPTKPADCKDAGTIKLPPIDLVISEAQDGYQTENEDATYLEDLNRTHSRAYLVTPHSSYLDEKVIQVQNADRLVDPWATVLFRRTRNDGAGPSGFVKVSYQNRVFDDGDGAWHAQNAPSCCSTTPTLPVTACGLTDDHDFPESADDQHKFEFCVLQTLQLATNSDIAMLQRRDFYFPKIFQQDDDLEIQTCKLSPGSLNDCLTQMMLERLLWKDDTPVLINLTGSQLKSVLSQSDALMQDDPRSEVKDVEQEWLVTTGVTKEAGGDPANPEGIPPDNLCRDDAVKEANALAQGGLKPASGAGKAGAKTYCVNGVPISDSQLYKIVTSKAIAGNEPVFPGISTPPPGWPAEDEQDDDNEHTISRTLGPTMGGAVHTASREWAHAASECQPDCAANVTRKLEHHQQQRRLLHVNLQNGEFSYSAYTPNLSDANLFNTFAGAADSRASSPSNSSILATDSLRVLEEGQYVDWGGIETLDFTLSRTGNQQGGFPTTSYASNNLSVGPLLQFHAGYKLFRQRDKGLPQWKITFSPALYQQQIRGNYFAFNFDPSLGITTFPTQARFRSATQKNVASRLGLRHEFNGGGTFKPDKGSYYEVGVEHNWYYDVLSELDFLNGGVLTLPCPILPNQSFAQCVKNAQKPPSGAKPTGIIVGPQTKIVGQYTELRTSGVYLDTIVSKQVSRAKLPSGLPLSILVQAKGDYTFRRDFPSEYTTQAYYAFTSSIGLQVPIYGNLSLVPSYGAFFYENLNTFHSLIAKSAALDVRWTFDHYTPVRWASDLSYTAPASSGANSSTASSSTGAKHGK